MPRSICVVAVAACLLAAGCGGSSSSKGGDEGAVDDAFHAYINGLADSNGAAACAKMTKSLQDQMIKAMESSGAGAITKGRSCAEILDAIAKDNPAFGQVAKLLRAAKTSNIKVDGDKASYDWAITVNGKTVNSHGEAVKTGDTWLVSCCVPGQ